MFDAIEQLGFVIDAFEAVMKGKTDYIEVFARHKEAIVTAGQEFISIRIVFEDYRETIERFLDKYRLNQLTLNLS